MSEPHLDELDLLALEERNGQSVNPAEVRALLREVRRLQNWRPAIEQALGGMQQWQRLSHKAACENVELRALATQLCLALIEHRIDMHQTSSRPCATCRQSQKALDAAKAFLGPEYPKREREVSLYGRRS